MRGEHRHKKTKQAAICISGSCVVSCITNESHQDFALNSPSCCIILNPEDWHTMHDFSKDAILMVLASEPFDPEDYIYESY